ncbi:hypothetical protein FRB90_011644, partial [Tulasnella sp. 427]
IISSDVSIEKLPRTPDSSSKSASSVHPAPGSLAESSGISTQPQLQKRKNELRIVSSNVSLGKLANTSKSASRSKGIDTSPGKATLNHAFKSPQAAEPSPETYPSHGQPPPPKLINNKETNELHSTDASGSLEQLELSRALSVLETPPITPIPSQQAQGPAYPQIQNSGIDFGCLVSTDTSGTGSRSIDLSIPCDGSTELVLRVGSSSEVDIKLDGNDIGSYHCFVELSLKKSSNGSQSFWSRTVKIKPRVSGNWPTTVFLGGDRANLANSAVVLTPGSIVVFGAEGKHSYRYQPPLKEVPNKWLTQNFAWHPNLAPIYGLNSKANCIVYLVKTQDKAQIPAALKIIPYSRAEERPELRMMANRERRALQSIKHKHILPLQAYRDDIVEQIIFVFPQMLGGNLLGFIKSKRTSVLRQMRLSNIFAPSAARQMLGALKFLREQDIVHRDMKPENILVEETWSMETDQVPKVVLADFGLARLQGEPRDKPCTWGSRHWISPRSFRIPEVEDYSMDLWGMALILWYIIAGIPKPWGERGELPHDEPLLDWVNMDGMMSLTNQCRKLLAGILVTSPSSCMSIEEAQAHEWVNGAKTVAWTVQDDGIYNADGIELSLRELGVRDEY